MASVTKIIRICDRCGSEADDTSAKTWLITDMSTGEVIEIDACGSCAVLAFAPFFAYGHPHKPIRDKPPRKIKKKR